MEPSTYGYTRKLTHTDLYLPWDSYHNLSAKYSMINTLSHRAQTICSTPQLLKNGLKISGESPYAVQISEVGYKKDVPPTTREE